MRNWIFMLMTVAALFSGCTEDNKDGTDVDDNVDGTGSGALPAPINATEMVVVGADPFNNIPNPDDPTGSGLPPCSQQVSTCYYYDFNVTEGIQADVLATLSWGIAANDFDLYLYQGETQVSSDGINTIDPNAPPAGAPVTEQVMNVTGLGPGEYTFYVVAWNVVGDTFVLQATFS